MVAEFVPLPFVPRPCSKSPARLVQPPLFFSRSAHAMYSGVCSVTRTHGLPHLGHSPRSEVAAAMHRLGTSLGKVLPVMNGLPFRRAIQNPVGTLGHQTVPS